MTHITIALNLDNAEHLKVFGQLYALGVVVNNNTNVSDNTSVGSVATPTVQTSSKSAVDYDSLPDPEDGVFRIVRLDKTHVYYGGDFVRGAKSTARSEMLKALGFKYDKEFVRGTYKRDYGSHLKGDKMLGAWKAPMKSIDELFGEDQEVELPFTAQNVLDARKICAERREKREQRAAKKAAKKK